MTITKKLRYILSRAQKVQALLLGMLMFVGMIFEMAGLGIIVPVLSLILNPDIGAKYPILLPYLKSLGNPTQFQIVLLGMSVMMLTYILKGVFMVFLIWKQNRFTLKLSQDLSCELFVGYLRQPYMFHLKTNSAVLLRNVQNEVGNLNAASQALISLSIELSIVLGVVFTLFIIEPLGSVIVTAFFAAATIGFHRSTKDKLLKWGVLRQDHQESWNKNLFESFGGVKEIKLLGREDSFLNKFEKHSSAMTNIQVKVATLSVIPRFYLEILAVTGLAMLSILMVAQNKPMDMILPTLGVFVAAAFRMIPSINRIMISMQHIRVSKPSIDVLYDEVKLVRNNTESVLLNSTMSFTQRLLIDNVSFRYFGANSNAVDQVLIEIKKGESVGFIGSSGSGKSTLVDLILGLLSPDSGQIILDGIDIKSHKRGWQNLIGYVPQAIYLTDDTLRQNVAFGIRNDQIDESALWRAIKDAQLDEFVTSLPEGLETSVGERGVRLSGGQRQRIGIARALYHNPEVLVLDEATSALDSLTEQGVMEAVTALRGTKTLLIVAHRLSTVEKCDRIYKLDNGKIIAQGIPEEILI